MTNLELKALLSISKIDLKRDIKQILNEILTIVGSEMGAHSGSIMLINEETGELEMVATFGLPDDYIERVYSKGVPITTSPSGMALNTGRYYPVSNIFEEPRTKPWMDIARELGFSSQLFMPIKQRGAVIGLLNTYMANPHEFTESEIAFVTIAASQAAAVIENARLYARILNKNVELEREITERKRAEEALRVREEQYRSIFESASEAFLIYDPKAERVVEVNPAACKMYGYSHEELTGLSGKDVVHPDYYHIFENFEEQVKSCRQFHTESVDVRKDGSTINIEVHGTHFNYKGKPHLLAVVLDITERKWAEKEIRKLSSAVEQSIDGIAVGDIELNLTYVNDAFARMHGYSSEEMIGKKVEDLHTEGQIDEYGRCINQIKAQGSWMGEIGHVRKDGTPFPTYMYFTLLKDDDGEPTGILAVARDITERKQVEEALFKKGVELQHQISERKQVEKVLEITERKCRDIAEFLPELISILPKLWSRELT